VIDARKKPHRQDRQEKPRHEARTELVEGDTKDTKQSQYNISTAKTPKNKSNSKFKKAVSAYEADIREALNKNPAEAGSAADSES